MVLAAAVDNSCRGIDAMVLSAYFMQYRQYLNVQALVSSVVVLLFFSCLVTFVVLYSSSTNTTHWIMLQYCLCHTLLTVARVFVPFCFMHT